MTYAGCGCRTVIARQISKRITRLASRVFARSIAFDGTEHEWLVEERKAEEAAARPGKLAKIAKRTKKEEEEKDQDKQSHERADPGVARGGGMLLDYDGVHTHDGGRGRQRPTLRQETAGATLQGTSESGLPRYTGGWATIGGASQPQMPITPACGNMNPEAHGASAGVSQAIGGLGAGVALGTPTYPGGGLQPAGASFDYDAWPPVRPTAADPGIFLAQGSHEAAAGKCSRLANNS